MSEQHAYYRLPLQFGRIWRKNEKNKSAPLPLGKVPIDESVKAHIRLILMTNGGEYHFDTDFGSELSKQDFEVIAKDDFNWRNNIADSIEKSLTAHEQRLESIRVSLDPTRFRDHVNGRLRKVIDIKIVGVLKLTDETFSHTERIMLSPISLE